MPGRCFASQEPREFGELTLGNRMSPLLCLVLPTILAGCQMTPPDSTSTGHPQVGSIKVGSAAWRGLKFARNRCSDCHAVESGQAASANPKAPAFVAVSNSAGLTKASLNRWLRTYSNHPREMYFEIPEEHIDDLVAYMLTLRTNDRRPSR